ncbi:MAG: site-specific integrase [Micavibrio aeruginosavorus]|uniref:Site-specific integrase n=1 Tax=Micavibrio aeruginosavorus TaxID=349221 RepID=A0A7T5UGW8_9BACT|nr:MAG: site-specific integrase [Micavibrio aeruginosavorus]
MAYIQERISKTGKKSYRALIRMRGYSSVSATFPRKTDAVLWAKETETAMHQGKYFKSSESRKRTVADLVDRYLDRVRKDSEERHENLKFMLLWWKQEIGHCILSNLTKAIISEKIDLLAATTWKLKNGTIKNISPARVNRYIAAFSHACTIAVNEWEWLESNPFQKISKLREPRGRTRFLDDDERARLLTECKKSKAQYLYPVVILALSTGSRQSEILGLKWKDIDFARKCIILHKTKNKEKRVVPLSGHAYDLIKELSRVRRIDTDLVFPSPSDPKQHWDVRASWDFAVKKAAIPDFRFHDLRHSAASYLAMNGATLAEISEVLGHKTLAMVSSDVPIQVKHTMYAE